EAATADRVDVAREALHELVPGIRIACPATGNELRVGLFHCHRAGRYDFETKRSAQYPVERPHQQLGVFIFERQRRPDLEHVAALSRESHEDPVLAQLLGDATGQLAARELDAGQQAAASNLDDVRLAERLDGRTETLADACTALGKPLVLERVEHGERCGGGYRIAAEGRERPPRVRKPLG